MSSCDDSLENLIKLQPRIFLYLLPEERSVIESSKALIKILHDNAVGLTVTGSQVQFSLWLTICANKAVKL